LPEAEEVEFTGDTETREPGGGGGLAPVEILEESGVRAADMEPTGDPQAAALLQQLANMGVRATRRPKKYGGFAPIAKTRAEARRASLSERVQNEAGGILGRLGIKHRRKTLDPRRRERNYTWVPENAAEIPAAGKARIKPKRAVD
jgi:hypothetical protein